MNNNNIDDSSTRIEIMRMANMTIESIISPIVESIQNKTKELNGINQEIMMIGNENQRLLKEYEHKTKFISQLKENVKDIENKSKSNAEESRTSRIIRALKYLRHQNSQLDNDLSLIINKEARLRIKESIVNALLNNEKCESIKDIVKSMKNNSPSINNRRTNKTQINNNVQLKSSSTSQMMKKTTVNNRSFQGYSNNKLKSQKNNKSSKSITKESPGSEITTKTHKISSQSFINDNEKDKATLVSDNTQYDNQVKPEYNNKTHDKIIVYNETWNINDHNDESTLTDHNNNSQRLTSLADYPAKIAIYKHQNDKLNSNDTNQEPSQLLYSAKKEFKEINAKEIEMQIQHYNSAPLLCTININNEVDIDSENDDEIMREPLSLFKEKAAQLKNQINQLHLQGIDPYESEQQQEDCNKPQAGDNEENNEQKYQLDIGREEINLKCKKLLQSLNTFDIDVRPYSNTRIGLHEEDISHTEERHDSSMTNDFIQNKELIYNRHINEAEDKDHLSQEDTSLDSESKKKLLRIKLEAMLINQQIKAQREVELYGEEDEEAYLYKLDSIEVIEERPEENDIDSKTITIDKDRFQVVSDKAKIHDYEIEKDRETIDSHIQIPQRINTTPTKSFVNTETTVLRQNMSIEHYINTEMQTMIKGKCNNVKLITSKSEEKDKTKETKETSINNTDNFRKETMITDNNDQVYENTDHTRCKKKTPQKIPMIPMKTSKIKNCTEPVCNRKKKRSGDLIMIMTTINKNPENITQSKSASLSLKNNQKQKTAMKDKDKKEGIKNNEKLKETGKIILARIQDKKDQAIINSKEKSNKAKKNKIPRERKSLEDNQTNLPLKYKSKLLLEIKDNFQKTNIFIKKSETHSKIKTPRDTNFDEYNKLTPKEIKGRVHNTIPVKKKVSKNNTPKKSIVSTLTPQKDNQNSPLIVSPLITHNDIKPRNTNNKKEIDDNKKTINLTYEKSNLNNQAFPVIPKQAVTHNTLPRANNTNNDKQTSNEQQKETLKQIEEHKELDSPFNIKQCYLFPKKTLYKSISLYNISNLFTKEILLKSIIKYAPSISKTLNHSQDTFPIHLWIRERLNLSAQNDITKTTLPIILKKTLRKKVKRYHFLQNLSNHAQTKHQKKNLYLLITKFSNKQFYLNPIKETFALLKRPTN